MNSGHYGILKIDNRIIGGFLNWKIAIELRHKDGRQEVKSWKATTNKWWLTEHINEFDAEFYQISNDKPCFIERARVITSGALTELNKMMKSKLIMNKGDV